MDMEKGSSQDIRESWLELRGRSVIMLDFRCLVEVIKILLKYNIATLGDLEVKGDSE